MSECCVYVQIDTSVFPCLELALANESVSVFFSFLFSPVSWLLEVLFSSDRVSFNRWQWLWQRAPTRHLQNVALVLF